MKHKKELLIIVLVSALVAFGVSYLFSETSIFYSPSFTAGGTSQQIGIQRLADLVPEVTIGWGSCGPPGCSVSYDLKVKNIGNAVAQSNHLEVTLFNTNLTYQKIVNISSLLPGQEGDVPIVFSGVEAGDYTLVTFVDSFNLVSESNESNNIIFTSQKIPPF